MAKIYTLLTTSVSYYIYSRFSAEQEQGVGQNQIVAKENLINTLPPEVLEKIFSFLDNGARLTSREVCKNWSEFTSPETVLKMKFISEKLKPTLGFFEKKLKNFDEISIHLMDFKATEKNLNLSVKELEHKSYEDLLSSFENNLVEFFSRESVLPEELVLPEEMAILGELNPSLSNIWAAKTLLDEKIFIDNNLISLFHDSFEDSLHKRNDIEHRSSYAPIIRKVSHSILNKLALDSIKYSVPEKFKIACLTWLLEKTAFYSFDKAIEIISLIPPEEEAAKVIGLKLGQNLYEYIICNYDPTFEPLLQKIEALANEEQKLKIMSSFLLGVIINEVGKEYNTEKDFESTDPKRIFDRLKDSLLLLNNIELGNIYLGLSKCTTGKNALLAKDYFLKAASLNIEILLLIANHQGELTLQDIQNIWSEPVKFQNNFAFIIDLCCHYARLKEENNAFNALDIFTSDIKLLNFLSSELKDLLREMGING